MQNHWNLKLLARLLLISQLRVVVVMYKSQQHYQRCSEKVVSSHPEMHNSNVAV